MKIMKFIVLLSLSATLAFSQEQFERILITKTTTKSNLSKINSSLKNIGVKMYVQTLSTGYYIYSKKYTNTLNAQKKLNKIKVKFPNAKIISINIPKENENNDEEILTKISNYFQQNNKKIFVNLAFGYANINGSTNDLSVSKTSNAGMSYTLEGGYNLYDNLSISLSYLNSSTSDISMYDIYSAVNYKYFLIDDISIGAGLILGYSSLELNNYPSSTPSTNMMYGYDLAVYYEFTNEFDFFTKYQGFFKNHVVNIDNTSKSQFDYTNNLLIGVGYKFK